ncbi:MAG: LamG-like jellyroll fold domain-containing protein, partial [Bacteroidota bacterium]
VDDVVSALCFIGDTLYAGGDFNNAGGIPAKRIAKWNGSSWSALSAGVYINTAVNIGGSVQALAVIGNDLYVGGSFNRAGGTIDGVGGVTGGAAISNIAKWNHSSWSGLGTGTNGSVAALTVLSGKLYAGGQFSTAGGTSANNIAQWNGSSWSALGSGTNGEVWALGTTYYGNLLVAGNFTSFNGTSVNNVADVYIDDYGISPSSFGSGLNEKVWALATSSSATYIGGVFTTAGGFTVNRIAKRGTDDGNWYPLGLEMNGIVRAAVFIGSDLYVAGEFTKVPGDVSASRIAKWNGSTWSALGSGVDSTVYSLAVIGSTLYAGGLFTTAGGSSANYIAQWNGSTWSALGTGMDGYVTSLTVIGSDLYAGGSFGTAGGTSAAGIAKWNGSSWSSLGSGVDGGVNALVVIGTDLYVAGGFSTAGGTSANNIAKWNGSSWSALGSGIDWYVYALAVIGTDLYAGGGFTTAGGTSANYIAKWNGSSWSALGSGMNGLVYSLTVNDDQLYAGGYFTTAGSSSANAVAKWDGAGWSGLGSGLGGTSQPTVYAIAANGDNVYVGGSFANAGTKQSHYIAHWNAPLALPTLTTSTLSGLTPSVAALSSTVNPQGLTTTLRVLFGTSSGNYTDSVLATQSPLTGAWVPTSVFVNATGLSNNQTYYAKLTATNSRGYQLGNEVSFTTPSPSAVSSVPGALLSFNGTTQYVSVPDDSLLRLTDNFTIEAWIYPTRTNNTIIDKGNYNYLLSVQPNGQSGLGLYNNGTWIYSSGSVPLNEWSHVAVVFQTGANGVKFYRNGVLLSEHTASGALVTNTGQLNIGRQAPGTCDCNLFEGKIDEVRMWNTARTAQQIRENMHRTLSGGESGLLAYWQLNENAGTSAGEPIGAHFGLLMNSPTWTTSTLPVGSATSASGLSFTNGTAVLDSVSLTTTEAFDNAIDLTATAISIAPNIFPAAYGSIVGNKYFVVNVFGSPGTFSTNLTFKLGAGGFDAAANTIPEKLRLYKRSSTSSDAWEEFGGAVSANSTTGEATWSGITSFSQFAVVYDESVLPIELTSFTVEAKQLNAELKWKTATELNNYGFEVQRSEASGHFERSEESRAWKKVGFVEGNGTTNTPKEYSFTDKNLRAEKYSYRLKQIDRDGKFTYSQNVDVTVGSAPKVFALEQNYPNPFNPTTTIGFTLQISGFTTLKIYDAIGREVATLVNENLGAGVYHQKTFDAGNLSSGIYFVRLKNNGNQVMKKMLLMK